MYNNSSITINFEAAVEKCSFSTTRNHRLLVFLLTKAPKGIKKSLALRGSVYLTTFTDETK